MKNTIVGIIIGVCLVVTAFHVWYLYTLNTRVIVLENATSQVVSFINQSIAQQQAAVEIKK